MLSTATMRRVLFRAAKKNIGNLQFSQSTMASDPEVKVVEGRLRGSMAKTPTGKSYYSFQGIPYAEPPVATLRFRDPRYPKPWSDIRDAIKSGNKCAQMDPLKPKKFEGSDDCLYLNVYTPSLPEKVSFASSKQSELEHGNVESSDSLLPVLVFIHGGRFLTGYADFYRPDYFLDQDVIVVTVNYRVAALGFLCLDIPEVPGNAGHKDIIFALRWLRENVHNFNGNPNNVTVMGESAATGIVTGLLASPMAEGLFHKVIVESGSCLHDIYFWEDDVDNVEKGREIVKKMGEIHRNPHDLLDYLEKSPLENILEALYNIERKKKYLKPYLAPVVEKKFNGVENFYTENPRTVLKNGKQIKVPMILGYNNLEGAFFLWRDTKGNIIYDMDLNLIVPMFLGFGMYSDIANMYVEDLKKFYFQGKLINEETIKNLVNLLSDQYFLRDMHILAELHAKYVDDVYFYQFSYQGSLNSRLLKNIRLQGATHSDMLGYQFLKPKKTDVPNDNDNKVIKLLAEGWCNFAKFGKPSWQHGPVEWLPVRENKLFTLDIDREVKLLDYPLRERIEFCKSLLDKYRQKSKV